MKLADRVAIVTGAGRGIGRAISLVYAREGAKVVLADVSEEHLSAVAAEIAAAEGESLAVPTDVRSKAQAQNLAKATLERFGRIDVLANVAGVGRHGNVADLSEEDWDLTFAVNVKGVFFCAQAVLPQMIAQHSGRILNMSSGAGLVAMPWKAAYCASKSAVIGFSASLAEEVGRHGINVNTVCPGPVATELRSRNYPFEDPSLLPQPEDVASLFLFLASDEARTVHNAVIRVANGPEPIRTDERLA
jgi:NAD(P)-dependent dehydrogenase (short-subunit alcohol dehydrogenase family)